MKSLSHYWPIICFSMGMKTWVILGIFLSMAAYGQEHCVEQAKNVCSLVDRSYEDHHSNFHSAQKEAFKDLLKNSDFKDNVCTYFAKGKNKLIYDVKFGRDCGWFSSYKRLIKNNNINNCSDFKKFGASSYFVDNCNEILDEELHDYVPTKNIALASSLVKKIRNDIYNMFEGDSLAIPVRSALNNILPHSFSAKRLSTPEAKLINLSQLCPDEEKKALCTLYSNKDKVVLSPGGALFLSEEALEAAIALAFSKYLAVELNRDFALVRRKLFDRILLKQNRISQERYEAILAKSVSFKWDVNYLTTASYILSKYFEPEREDDPMSFSKKVGYYCFKDPQIESTSLFYMDIEEFYRNWFGQLHRYDRVGIMMCSAD